nr:Chain A, Major prion protein [Mus musculus]
MIHFGND